MLEILHHLSYVEVKEKRGIYMKKRILGFISVISILSSLTLALPITASADTYGIYTYTVTNGEATITDCDDSASGDIVIPERLGRYPVTSIGEDVFAYRSNITSITMPDSITSIGACAFETCWDLTSITMSDSLKSISVRMFWGCDSLASITIPDSVTSIDKSAFAGCDSLTSIIIPDGVQQIGEMAFEGCSNLTYITIPEEVKEIGEMAFVDCSSLENIIVDDGNSVYSSVDGNLLSKDKTVLIQYAPGKKNESYIVPDTVNTIEYFAFGHCNLTSITISENVTDIGIGALAICGNLEEESFAPSLTNITVEEGNPNYSSVDGNLFNKDKTKLIQYANAKVDTSYTIPDGVTSIGDYAFAVCSNLTSITIPDGVTNIGDGAFSGCSNLTGITIPNGVTSIGDYTFTLCSNLTSITIPEGVTSIGHYTFSECSNLTSITIPESVINIGGSAFSSSGIETVYYTGTREQWNAITISGGNDKLINAKIVFEYCAESEWWSYSIVDGYAIINGYLGADNEIVVPKKMGKYPVTSISNDAFFECTNLTSITILDSVTSIGDWAFGWCSNLTSITIPDSVTSMGHFVFDGCSNLTDVKLGRGITTIPYYTFNLCSSLKTVTIPKTVTTISNDTFKGCKNFTVYYSGTEEEWGQIDIDEDNDELLNAPIYFLADNSIKTINACVNGYNVSFDAENGAYGSIIIALYDSHGRMKECVKYYAIDNNISRNFENINSGDYAKVFWLSDLTNLKPMCEAELISL